MTNGIRSSPLIKTLIKVIDGNKADNGYKKIAKCFQIAIQGSAGVMRPTAETV